MDWGAFVRGVLENLTAHWIEWLLVIGVPAVIAIAKRRSWPWIDAVTSGLVALAAMLVIVNVGFFTPPTNSEIEAQKAFSQAEADIIEKKLRNWLDITNITVMRQTPNDKQFFNYKVIYSGTNASVSLERKDRLIFIRGGTNASPKFMSLTEKQQEKVKDQLELELLHSGVQFIVGKNFAELKDEVPYSDELTQHEFIQRVRGVVNATKIAILFLWGGENI
jgi:hypothetical protein